MIHFAYAHKPDGKHICSPCSITNHLYYYLSLKGQVTFHNYLERKKIELQEGDIFIGHPHFDSLAVTQQTILDNTKGKKYLLFPFHHYMPKFNMPFNDVVMACDKYFAITGPYWHQTIRHSKFAHWEPKMVRLDMAVNYEHFPRQKASFNDNGQRRILYIGRNSEEKNPGLLRKIIHYLSDVHFVLIGIDIEAPNTTCLGRILLDDKAAKSLCERCDYFINTSISDANPTTILETASWGLIPICTRQSGYYEGELVYNIPLQAELAAKRLREILSISSEALMERSLTLTDLVKREYNWDKFCSTVWTEIANSH